MTMRWGKTFRCATAAAAIGLLGLGAVTGSPVRAETSKKQSFSPRSVSGAYLAARHAERRFALSEAATLYARALAENPDNLPLLNRTFYLMIADGRVDAAVPLARRIYKVRPEARLANLVLALDATKRGRAQMAERHLAPLPDQGVNRVLLPLLKGWVAFAGGRRDQALKLVRDVADVPGYANFHTLHSGLMLELAGQTKAAGERYKKALEPKSSAGMRIIQAIGIFYERNGQRAAAAALYAKLAESRPDSLAVQMAQARLKAGRRPAPFARNASEAIAEALFNVGTVVRRARRQRQALIYARLANYMRPRFAPAQILIASVLEARNQKEAAIAIYRNVPRREPLGWTAQLAAAQALSELDRVDEAAEILERMAKERPARWDALIALGDIYRSKERFKEAAKTYDLAFARIPKLERRHWGLLYARGIALERSKKWARAEQDFLKALEFQPNQPFVLNYLGYSWVEQGKNLTRARKMIETAVRLRPNDGYIIDSLGWVLYRMGRFKEAVPHLEKAVRIRPHDPTINDHLGDAYWMVGRQREANFQWRRALSLKPEKEQVPVIQTKIRQGLKAPNKTPGAKN